MAETEDMEVQVLAKKKKDRPTSSQKSIPYIECYPDGMIQVEPGKFSKTWSFPDMNFKTLSEDEQRAFHGRFQDFLNSIDPAWHVTFNILNILDDIDLRFAKVSLKERSDELDKYRKEMNKMIYGRMRETRGSIITKRYITYTIEAKSVDDAALTFKDIDISVNREFRQFIKAEPHCLSLDERLELLAKIYGTDDSIYFKHDRDGKVSVDWDAADKLHLTTKDIIAPPAMSFKNNYFNIGEQVAQSYYLTGIANYLSADFIGNITDVNCKLILSIDILPLESEEAIKLIHNKSVLIDSEIAEAQKKAVKSGYSPDLISPDLSRSKEQVDSLQEDMMSQDQKVFYMQLNVTHFASDMDDLKRTGAEIKSVASKNLCSFSNYVICRKGALMPVCRSV